MINNNIILTDVLTSSRVVAKDSTNSCGKSEMNPTVSTNRAFIPLGSLPWCAVVSSVANSLFSGFIEESFESNLASVVLPDR